MYATEPGYDAGLLGVWRGVARDWRRGERTRARARLGFLTPPQERGRLIWIRAGADAESLRLGIELLGFVRHKRQDVRIVLTFERDWPELFERHMQPFRKVGVGYGPCDRPRVVRRVLERFQPAGIILAGGMAPRHLLEAAAAPVIAVNAAPPDPAPTRGPVLGWPRDPDEQRRWNDATGEAVSPRWLEPADPMARFVEAQADVVLRSLVGGEVRRLWWWHGTRGAWPAWHEAWQASGFAAEDILLASVEDDPEQPLAGRTLRVSEWDREPRAPGDVLQLDDPRWFAAAASAAQAVHLDAPGSRVLWQALAGGSAVSVGKHGTLELPVEVHANPAEVFTGWASLRDDAAVRRQRGDAARRRFWDERRRVDAHFETLLAEVWDW
ncbi:glycosyltransferase N-terminal domain-containing protein [Thioalkalivibrio sp. ALJ24]|uniref:glycosyltransferase N-terminal domain-containing protein n=1 Tax=Thioalkalivibrio sp. ALJ24 TaxID=545276 RepID=UPI0003A753FB|nr:glycosyltransferase N-terminal domain-containing protein [Thioalkalivibrio sp. ALJ24]